MATQSHASPIPIVLTRPAAQGAAFADAVAQQFGDRLLLVRSPLLAPRFLAPALPNGRFAALVLTSQTGVAALQRFGHLAQSLPTDVYCVGQNTAAAAKAAGLTPLFTAPDAAGLITHILAHPPAGRLLHLRGQDTRGAIAETLVLAGIDTSFAVTYAQQAQRLTAEASTVLRGRGPVIVPLFSPRTARLFAAELARVGGISPLFIIAMSDQIALEAAPCAAQITVAATPDTAAMLASLAVVFATVQRA